MARDYQRYTKEELTEVVNKSYSFAEVARQFGKSPRGGLTTHLRKMCDRLEIDYTHMTRQGHAKGKRSNKKLAPGALLVCGESSDNRVGAKRLRDALIEIGVPYICNDCGMEPVWNNKPITLEVDHIDECYWNNVATNLQFLCPNCHTQKTLGTA